MNEIDIDRERVPQLIIAHINETLEFSIFIIVVCQNTICIGIVRCHNGR